MLEEGAGEQEDTACCRTPSHLRWSPSHPGIQSRSKHLRIPRTSPQAKDGRTNTPGGIWVLDSSCLWASVWWESNSVRCWSHCFWSFLRLWGQVLPMLFSLSNQLLEFVLLYFLGLTLIHLNLFLNMLRYMGPTLYSSRWMASCASIIYQILLNRKNIFFVLY